MKARDFVQQERVLLAEKLEGYLTQRISHVEIQKHIDGIFESWGRISYSVESEPYAIGENEFWCAVWATQHLASQDHWIDGIVQKEHGILQKVLLGEALLPVGYVGKRP